MAVKLTKASKGGIQIWNTCYFTMVDSMALFYLNRWWWLQLKQPVSFGIRKGFLLWIFPRLSYLSPNLNSWCQSLWSILFVISGRFHSPNTFSIISFGWASMNHSSTTTKPTKPTSTTLWISDCGIRSCWVPLQLQYRLHYLQILNSWYWVYIREQHMASFL